VSYAQNAGISGTVRDSQGAALPGVTVEVTSPALIEKVRTAVTDGNGRSQITALPVGTYSVACTLPSVGKVVRDSVEQVVCAMKALEKRRGVAECAVEINRLENEADRAHQAAVQALFKDEKDPIAVIKWKEILDFLEQATDRCEDVANVLEGVVVKHA
jgi:hypothetical protein